MIPEEREFIIIVDPNSRTLHEAAKILKFLNENEVTMKYNVNTRGHTDHKRGNAILK
jgi:hypothetical protein